MSITINLEIGHDASLRTKTTPEGFTHDWEVYVKGCNGAEIHYYVEKVVFHLHETFPKPKRVVKEPPYSLRTSGYAGFNLPIEIYLRNNQEPKKIRFNYDLQLQPRGPPIHNVQKEKYVFHSPSEDFRSKLLKGGGVVGLLGSAQDTSDNKVIDEKNQMTSKPKLSGSDVAKKHRIKPEEPRNTDFLNLFGTPITKTSKTPEPPKPKDVSKTSSKTDKPVDKDKSKTKSPHKEKEKSKDKDKSSESSEKRKDEKKKSKEDKTKDRSKEKSSKKDKERDKSPSSRPRSPSPKRSPKCPMSPPPQKHSREKEKDQPKDDKKEKDRKEEKKNKKEKREHKDSKHKDRDKEKDHKEHKSRDSKSSKDSSVKEKDISPIPSSVAPSQQIQKTEKRVKEKEPVKESKDEDKADKSRQEKSDDKQKHKHKKKDRKEKRDEKYSRTEKKSEKLPALTAVKEEGKESIPVSSTDKSNLFGSSPKSDPPSTPNQIEEKTEKPNVVPREDDTSNDSTKVSSREPSPAPRAHSKSPASPSEPVKKPEPEKKKEEPSKKKDKKEKKKDKKSDRDHEKRRKRKSPANHVAVDQPPEKILKEEENNNSDDERKVSSTEDANPLPKNEQAEDYMGMLRDLQHKIMGLKDNSDLQKVVQLIAETGRYEVSAHTFDFDLCLLDRSTVRQLQDFFSSIS